MKNRVIYWGSSLLGVLTILFVIRLLTLWVWPLLDPTEGRYAETARQMVICNDWVIPHVWLKGSLVPFLGKPPLYFWVSALWIEILGATKFAVRMGSVTGAVVTLLSLYFIGIRYFSKQTVMRILVVTLSMGLFFAIAGTIGVDMFLTGTITLAYMSYYAWLREDKFYLQQVFSTLFFIGIGLSFMTKGAVGIVTVGMPIFLWHCLFGEWKKVLLCHAWILGGLSMLLITVPWFYLAQERMEQEGINFIHYFFIEEHFNRFTTKNYFDPYGSGHVMVRGMALLFMWVATLPWGSLTIAFFWKLSPEERRFSLKKNVFWSTPTEAFFFLGFAINTIFWCFATQYLITYFVPLSVFFAVWFVLRFESKTPFLSPWIHRIALFMAFSMIGVYFIVGYGFFPWLQGKQYAFEHFDDIEELIEYDQRLNENEKFKIVIYEPRNFSSVFFHGEKSGRILFNTDTTFHIKKKTGEITFKAKKALTLDQSLPITEALKVYTQKDDILYLVSYIYLEKALNVPKGSLRWTPLEGMKLSWNQDESGLLLGKVDSARQLDILDQDGDFLLIHPVDAK